jgi:hypothetical protein
MSLNFRGCTQSFEVGISVLRRMCGPEREEGTRVWGKLHNVEVCNLWISPNSIRIIRSRWISLAMHVACMGELRNTYKTVFLLSVRPVQELRLAAVTQDRMRMVPRSYFGLPLIITILLQSLCVWYLLVANRMFVGSLRMSWIRILRLLLIDCILFCFIFTAFTLTIYVSFGRYGCT